MGEVWAVTHEVTRRAAALKFLNAHPRPDRRRRFLREARAASAVNHPNVVQIHDFFELDDGTPVMLMDLLEGETLGQRLARERSLSLADALDVLLPVVSAVGTAHSVGIVHRDLKPDNVFLLGSPGFHTGVCVLDFGIAKLSSWDAGGAGDAGDGLTDTGALLGTPSYMSPEQSFGEKDIDHRTDVWSIGVMLYESLAGTRPIEGENPRQILKHLVSQVITPIEVLVPDLPSEVAELIGSMLARNAAKRPNDLRPVLDVLVQHGAVRVQGFDAAVRERPAPLDSSPASVRSSPYAVIRAPDAGARTIVNDLAATTGDVAAPPEDIVSAPLPLAPPHSTARRGWLLVAVALASGLVYGAVRLLGSADPAPGHGMRQNEATAVGDKTVIPATTAGEQWGVASSQGPYPAAAEPSAGSPSPTLGAVPATPRENGRAAAKVPSPPRAPGSVRKAVPLPAGGPGLVDEPPF
jgi:hypothetical protein